MNVINLLETLGRPLYSMGRRLRQNDTNISEIYIGRPLYISDVRYQYTMSDIQYPISARARARARAGISDVGYIYWTSDIDFENIGDILS